MANIYQEPSKKQITTVLRTSNLNILLLFILFAGMYLLSGGFVILKEYVFYMVTFIGIGLYTMMLLYVQNKRGFLLDLMAYDINDAWTPILVWGLGFLALLGVFYKALGTTIAFPSPDIIIYQMFLVCPAETFIFVIFLPQALENEKKFMGLSGWVWASGIFFATFHWWAYQANIFNMVLAFVFGLIFYAIYKYGDKNKRIGGIMATICIHFVWNFWALSTGTIV